ncbi:helix-turn-helix domain-containing protein [Nostoc sp. FACHB-110]|uniref:helix-turn-helix domain-containing protein n=1 Tax=Nostoc sp. FACHB-110 TaxID=2692834 RepID=UPI0016859ED2|nr:RodZ domain-containing protein [Nostoc sp. FACHB-110]MBD2438225.1 helix-turn-helix domain-containing protein [Nostoc sp. FACHB-110]
MKLLQDNQKEQLQEISKHLRQVREARSIRIEEVALKTNIRLAFLKAIDEQNFDDLPEPVYVQGFIRRYAEVIGLDGAALAKNFATEVTTPQFDSNRSQNFDKKLNIRIPLFIPYVVLLLVAATGLIYVLNPQFSAESLVKKLNLGTSQKQTTAVTSIPTSSTPPETSVSGQITPQPIIASPNQTINQDVAISLELQGKSWLQVKADGKTEFVGYLTKGDRRTWKAKKQLTVRSGNAGFVLVSVNNQPAKPLGGLGNVKEVTFTPAVNGQ